MQNFIKRAKATQADIVFVETAVADTWVRDGGLFIRCCVQELVTRIRLIGINIQKDPAQRKVVLGLF